MSQIDHNVWMEQPRLLNECCRGQLLIWTPDAKWFNNDWLGPTQYMHDEATEINFPAQSSLEIQIGGSQWANRYQLIPANTPHQITKAGFEPQVYSSSSLIRLPRTQDSNMMRNHESLTRCD